MKAVFIVTTQKVVNSFGIMIKVLLLIFRPVMAWDKIAQEQRGFTFIFTTYLLPMLALVTAGEGWGLEKWGKWQPPFQKFREFTPRAVEHFEVAQCLLLLVTIFVCAFLILKVSQTFHDRQNYLQAFTLTAYGFSPLLLLHLLNIAPTMNPFITWSVGAILSIWILYQGLPRVLMPDPTHAFGLYLSSALVIILMTGMTHMITALYLLGYMDFNHSWLSNKLAPFLSQ